MKGAIELWSTLVKAALIGTGSHGPFQEKDFDFLASLGLAVSQDSTLEHQLLHAAAVLGSCREATYDIADSLNTLPYAAAELEEQPYCSEKAANFLEQILQNNQSEILIEWLEVMQAKEVLAPAAMLPDLLAFGALYERLRTPLIPVLGRRGLWLAQFNNRWNYAAVASATNSNEEQFQLGSTKERLHYLQQLRKANPSAAKSLMEESWETEDYPTRTAFLSVLEHQLSKDDLPFLEFCLKDRRKEVRQEAARLLAILPESSLIKRIIQQLDQLVQYLPKSQELKVELLEKLSKSLKTDGIREHFKPLPEGKKANWLAQMISLIPTEHWESQWDLSPEECLSLALNNDYRNVWWWGWAMSAKSRNNEDWLLAMHRYIIDFRPSGKKSLHFSIDFMYNDLSNELFNQLAWEYLEKDPNALLSDDHPVMMLLLQEHQRWNNQLSFEIIRRIKITMTNDTGVFNWNQKTLLKRAAFAIHPTLYQELEKDWPAELGYSWQSELSNFLATLRFRRDIHNLSTTP